MMDYFAFTQRSAELATCNIPVHGNVSVASRLGTFRLIYLFIAFWRYVRFMSFKSKHDAYLLYIFSLCIISNSAAFVKKKVYTNHDTK